MRRNDFTTEYQHMVGLLELRSGELVLDARAEADQFPYLLHGQVTERGRTVCATFGKQTFAELEAAQAAWHTDRIEVTLAHISALPFRERLFHGVVLRSTDRLAGLDPALAEMTRVAKPGARILVRHSDWKVELPGARERERELIAALNDTPFRDGQACFAAMRDYKGAQAWTDLRYDIFCVAGKRTEAACRYDYDWRTMMRAQLGANRHVTVREILDLIARLEANPRAVVQVTRYLAVGLVA